jgi:hypothetical protein
MLDHLLPDSDNSRRVLEHVRAYEAGAQIVDLPTPDVALRL